MVESDAPNTITEPKNEEQAAIADSVEAINESSSIEHEPTASNNLISAAEPISDHSLAEEATGMRADVGVQEQLAK